MTTINISNLMEESGVKFGTSGARGLADDITDKVAYSYTKAFLQNLKKEDRLGEAGSEVAIAGDLRPSSDRIMEACAKAVQDMGLTPSMQGKAPSPSVAFFGLRREAPVPTVMVTGSHIPADRNGIKYTTPDGEITKKDETGIKSQDVSVPEGLFDEKGSFCEELNIPKVQSAANQAYVGRYTTAFPALFLKGKKIGVYQHSAVGRDIMTEIYRALGAEVVELGRSDIFIPVDTEAIRPEDVKLAADWATEYGDIDCIVSTDGDSDRPLVADEKGNWMRGDVLGILVAEYLGADAIATPVSCNSAAEKSSLVKTVLRTRIGSPFVIAGMNQLSADSDKVVGYEANGGFLTNSDFSPEGDGTLTALPTRDAVLPHIAVMGLSIRKGVPVSELTAKLPQRFTASDRLKEFPNPVSHAVIAKITAAVTENNLSLFDGMVQDHKVVSSDTTDGVRLTLDNDQIVHFRPSGNAPEFRCYSEAETPERAETLMKSVLAKMEAWRSFSADSIPEKLFG